MASSARRAAFLRTLRFREAETAYNQRSDKQDKGGMARHGGEEEGSVCDSADKADPNPWRIRRGGTEPGGGALARRRFCATFVAGQKWRK